MAFCAGNMTFSEFAHLEPGAVVCYQGRRVIYVRALRAHPMMKVFADLTGLPINLPRPGSVMTRLREAHAQVRVRCDASEPDWGLIDTAGEIPGLRCMTDDEILASESKDDPYAYYEALIQRPGRVGAKTPFSVPVAAIEREPRPPPCVLT